MEARPRTFTQAAGLVLWYNTEAYLALDLTWAEPEGEEQRGQQWRGGGRTCSAWSSGTRASTRQVAVVDVDAESAMTLGVTVVDGAGPFLVRGRRGRTDSRRAGAGLQPALRRPRLPAAVHRGDGRQSTPVDLVDAAFTADFTGFRLSCG